MRTTFELRRKATIEPVVEPPSSDTAAAGTALSATDRGRAGSLVDRPLLALFALV